MPVINITTTIHAPMDRCFDLARSIDLHKISTEHTNEEAIAGVTAGLISMGESVTWKARHFGVVQTLTSKITEYDRPNFFVDEMVEGAFSRFRHEHRFTFSEGITSMTDIFDYTAPFGVLGNLANALILNRYMRKLLISRNAIIKNFAETERWREVLRNPN